MKKYFNTSIFLTGLLVVSISSANVSFDISNTSFFYNQRSRFSDTSARKFSQTIANLLVQLGCTPNIDTYRRDVENTIVDSQALEMNISASCENRLDISFVTMTTEIIKQASFTPDRLFLNGRLVNMSENNNKVTYSDGEVITLENLGSSKAGYFSHASKKQNLDHVDNEQVYKETLHKAGYRVGLSFIGIGALVKALGSEFFYFNILQKAYLFLGNPAWFNSLFRLSTFLSGNAAGVAAAGSIAVGSVILFLSTPTKSAMSDLHKMYINEAFKNQMLNSKEFHNLENIFHAETVQNILSDYLKEETSVHDLVKKYSHSEQEQKAIIDFYYWYESIAIKKSAE